MRNPEIKGWSLTTRGWIVLFVVVALAAIAFMVWSDATWLSNGPTAEQEATWLR